jgi:hypothetical protein
MELCLPGRKGDSPLEDIITVWEEAAVVLLAKTSQMDPQHHAQQNRPGIQQSVLLQVQQINEWWEVGLLNNKGETIH